MNMKTQRNRAVGCSAWLDAFGDFLQEACHLLTRIVFLLTIWIVPQIVIASGEVFAAEVREPAASPKANIVEGAYRELANNRGVLLESLVAIHRVGLSGFAGHQEELASGLATAKGAFAPSGESVTSHGSRRCSDDAGSREPSKLEVWVVNLAQAALVGAISGWIGGWIGAWICERMHASNEIKLSRDYRERGWPALQVF